MSARSRRALLQALAGTAAALAGCQSDGETTTTRTTTTTTTTTTSTTTETATTSEEPEPSAIGGDPGPLPDLVWPHPQRAASKTAYLPAGPGITHAPAVDWAKKPTWDESGHTPVYSPPVVVDDEVYTVLELRFGPQQPAPEEHYLEASMADGSKRWRAPLAAPDNSTPVPTPPAVHGAVVLVGVDQAVQAVDRETGDLAWRVAVEDSVAGVTPAGERIYVRAHRSVAAIEGQTVAWRTPFEEYPGALAVGADALFVATTRRLHLLDRSTGRVQWTKALPAVEGGWAVDQLLAVPGGVIARQNSGDLYAYTADGREVWRTNGIKGAIATDGTTLYVGTSESIRALRVHDGEERWERTCSAMGGCANGGQPLSLVATDDTVYAPLARERLAALTTSDGAVRWHRTTPEWVERLALTEDAIYGVGDSVTDQLVRFVT